jgi:hypothetical protein
LTWRRSAFALLLVLFALVLLRAVTLELDPYDAYELRSSARAIAGDHLAPFAIYRSPLLVLLETPFEALARGSRLTWVFPHLVTAFAYLALALGTARLAKAAGAKETTALAAGLALALDRLAFADAPLGLPDGLAAALATWGLALALEERLLTGSIFLGLAAATRPNDGLACLGLLAFALPEKKLAPRAFAAATLSVVIFIAISATFFALGGKGAFSGFAELARFQHAQLAENYEKYGHDHPRVLVALRSIFFMEPGTALLAPIALALARTRRALALVVVAIAHFVFLTTLAGHVEARYVLPVLPALAALTALFLDRTTWRRPALAAWLLLPLLSAPYELARARDPIFERNASLEVANAVAAISTSGSVYYAPVPFPVYPRVLAHTPFEGDPFHGIHHMGPVTIGYHLERPIVLVLNTPDGTDWIERFAADKAPGDVLILGTHRHVSWLLTEDPPELRIYRLKPLTPAPSLTFR